VTGKERRKKDGRDLFHSQEYVVTIFGFFYMFPQGRVGKKKERRIRPRSSHQTQGFCILRSLAIKKKKEEEDVGKRKKGNDCQYRKITFAIGKKKIKKKGKKAAQDLIICWLN